MSLQYLRQCSLIVGSSYTPGTGIELGNARVVFQITRGDTQTPNACDVRVYNLSDQTANKIAQLNYEFTRLQLQVSYQGGTPATIFSGSLTQQARRGRENQLNSYVDLTAADGDEAYNFSLSAFALAKNNQPANTAKSIIATMVNSIPKSSPTGGSGGQAVTNGAPPPFSTNGSPRGRVCFGSSKDELRDLCQSFDSKWFIENGAVTVVPNTGYLPGSVAVISPFTGLIGVPEQTQNGLKVRTLLNPNVKIGQLIQLISDVNKLRFQLNVNAASQRDILQKTVLQTNADGYYYVMRAEHSGDTRGTPWYSDLTCLAVNADIPITGAERTAVLEANAVKPFPNLVMGW